MGRLHGDWWGRVSHWCYVCEIKRNLKAGFALHIQYRYSSWIRIWIVLKIPHTEIESSVLHLVLYFDVVYFLGAFPMRRICIEMCLWQYFLNWTIWKYCPVSLAQPCRYRRLGAFSAAFHLYVRSVDRARCLFWCYLHGFSSVKAGQSLCRSVPFIFFAPRRIAIVVFTPVQMNKAIVKRAKHPSNGAEQLSMAVYLVHRAIRTSPPWPPRWPTRSRSPASPNTPPSSTSNRKSTSPASEPGGTLQRLSPPARPSPMEHTR